MDNIPSRLGWYGSAPAKEPVSYSTCIATASKQPCATKPGVQFAVSMSLLTIPLAQLTIINVKDKTSWWGCGFHVPSVMDSIPKEEWCTCNPRVEKKGVKYPPAAPAMSSLMNTVKSIFRK